jgi:uncharacterized membrane protein YraQ (UPF0718 family)
VVLVILLLASIVVWLAYWPPSTDAWSVFTNVFLGIFIEAVPFLMLGTLASGLIEVFVDQSTLKRLIPRSVFLSAVLGGLMGLFFPVCECGVVPLVRRLFRKGLPIPAGVAFLLAAPVINPIVLLSTGTAFGFGKIFFMRAGFTFLIAVIVALIFSTAQTPWEILRPTPWIQAETSDLCLCEEHDDDHEHEHDHDHTIASQNTLGKIFEVFQIAIDEFFEIGRYLILGGLIAAGMQAFIPQSILLNVGTGPVVSVLVMMALAVLLSICSTVDSFVALGFMGTFSTGAIVAFLVYGAMVDIKSTLMYLRVFRTRAAIYLLVVPFFLVLLLGVMINYYLGG